MIKLAIPERTPDTRLVCIEDADKDLDDMFFLVRPVRPRPFSAGSVVYDAAYEIYRQHPEWHNQKMT